MNRHGSDSETADRNQKRPVKQEGGPVIGNRHIEVSEKDTDKITK